jgi:hypothetical protein
MKFSAHNFSQAINSVFLITPPKQPAVLFDIDWFTPEEVFDEDVFYDESFVGYTAEALTIDSLYFEADTINMLICTVKTLK